MNDLSELMREIADTAHGGHGAGERALRAGRRRVRVRRAVSVTAGVALAASLVVVAVPLSRAAWPTLSDTTPSGQAAAPAASGTATPPPGAPDPTATGTTAPAPSLGPVTIRMAAGQPTVPAFPYTADWLPAGLGLAMVGFRGAVATLEHYSNDRTRIAQLYVEVGPGRPAEFSGEPVTVRGAAGRWQPLPGTTCCATLTWQERPDRWVVVRASGVPRADVVRFADSLRERTNPPTQGLAFTVVPEGCPMDAAGRGHAAFRLPGAPSWPDAPGYPTTSRDEDSAIEVRLGDKIPGAEQVGRAVSVGNRPGRLLRGWDTRLTVDLGGGHLLEILVPHRATVSDADLIRFASGISVTVIGPVGVG